MTASELYAMTLFVTGILAVWGGAAWLAVKLFLRVLVMPWSTCGGAPLHETRRGIKIR